MGRGGAAEVLLRCCRRPGGTSGLQDRSARADSGPERRLLKVTETRKLKNYKTEMLLIRSNRRTVMRDTLLQRVVVRGPRLRRRRRREERARDAVWADGRAAADVRV